MVSKKPANSTHTQEGQLGTTFTTCFALLRWGAVLGGLRGLGLLGCLGGLCWGRLLLVVVVVVILVGTLLVDPLFRHYTVVRASTKPN